MILSREQYRKAQNVAYIRRWMSHHKDFINILDAYDFEMRKGWHKKRRITVGFIEELFDEYDLHPVFPARELLEVWKRTGSR